MLLKSMSRIKIPKDFLDLTENILTDRSCQIITPYGLTDHIPISQGIPQGETISPLWWVIFYDPLLTKLHQSHDKPYNLINNLAFMDDINLLSPNKNTLQSLLNTTTQFLSFNNISVNSQKIKLIIINSKEKDKKITLNFTTILPNKKKRSYSNTRHISLRIINHQTRERSNQERYHYHIKLLKTKIYHRLNVNLYI
jgi:hypothetical protein